MQKLLIVSLLCTALFACKSQQKKTEEAASITMLASPAGDSCAEPYLFTDAKGMVHLSWVEKKGKTSTLLFSSLQNEKWSKPIAISSGNNWFVNWADYPVISSDANGNMLAHFLEKSDTAKFTYDVKVTASSDHGKTWSQPTTLHDDGKKAEHGFVSIIPYNEQFMVSWLDGRKTAMEGEHSGHEGHHGEMTLRGALLDKAGKKTKEWELDGRICDCCQTTIAVTTNGPVVVYRDRSDEEIRDMSIVRLVNGEWTQPKTIFADAWKIAGCPVNGPRADAIGNNLAIAWFSMKDKQSEVKVIFSADGGATFQQPIRIDEGKTIGRVDLVLLDEQTAMVSWMEGATIKAMKVHKDGTKEKPVVVAESSDARSSSFPQMTKAGDQLIFAWTDSKAKTIKLAALQLN
ncbi:BNR repeat protein [Lacibacter cauensis]|uniref:BNR repeat protein n=1 Tax=Lacibacter cauensis TaxID=510947 RepID=A0A562SGX4_9BACT|nr:sialidase family protein [Lacibacter cauensis]TWI80363.1 BNR repeat protein [Lacibacter cauensis]